jgi:hypothetical protein
MKLLFVLRTHTTCILGHYVKCISSCGLWSSI